LFGVAAVYTDSTATAMPCPTPMHMAARGARTGQDLAGECLVQLQHVEIGRLEAEPRAQFPGGRRWAGVFVWVTMHAVEQSHRVCIRALPVLWLASGLVEKKPVIYFGDRIGNEHSHGGLGS
jgi:hypothetical protein